MWIMNLRRHSEVSLARQIYQVLREQMTAGQLRPGELLPSTRELAKLLSVSRNTTYEAYEMLSAEGYIVSRQGSQTRVAAGLHLEKPAPALEDLRKAVQSAATYLADFRTGRPDLQRFPRTMWLQLLRKATENLSAMQWGYTGPEGLPVLREEIAAWLLRSRGLTVHSRDIFITAGATQALHLLAGLLAEEEREILVEDPCHVGMLQVLHGKGFKIRPVPVDNQGIQTEFLTGDRACAVYVTPSHQFPLGGILPAGRRADLIRFARNKDLYVIEDDYDSEFRYRGTPVAPLYSMDTQRVIYVGTFSKILFPALRIGYVVLPPELHKRWCRLRTYADVQNPPFEQAALAEYLHTRKLDRHIQQMRRLYGQRRQLLLQTLEVLFGRTWFPWGDAAGLHLVLEFPGMHFDHEFARRCKKCGIYVTPVDDHSICKGIHLDKLILGYGHLEPAEIKQGLLLLQEQFQKDSRN
ncbi:HTH-type transcriptional regulatory protein GabR [Sporomusa ovata DSM 2662]|uniref:Transcriptional regulator, GntR family domain / Aspartate aminotransferase n=1 Tax=Sporomusa ovata TaxID=2378 RepID=A0A0U1L0H5_9FIRM|nr:PLP-dependent aminotransferase family protein [Sporomusa ovata]EQB27322.1 transcriptional regulator GntR family [Sporomusa ovata DSM 2662]CQR73162.1 Transcriptional regulator, GntR family domain / Aspartate aminotransferase [Sporomusa ovata]